MCIRDSINMTRTFLCLLLAAAADAQFPGMGGDKKSDPIKADLPYIECAVCEALVGSLHDQVQQLPPATQPKSKVASRGKAPKGKVNEADVSDVLEKVCNPKEKQGHWMASYDLVSENGSVELVPQEARGQCKRECETIAQSCTDLFEKVDDNLDDLQVALWKGLAAEEIKERLCREWSEVCPRNGNMKPTQREVDEEFTVMSDKEAQMEELMKSFKGIPGMGGASMMDRAGMDAMASQGSDL
eukprot:TRINITY_DN21248_c0_g1_i1.p1 TRINITY_DN21248_c0_g1~~TRINITY_DN21248_c0_g1_i1.p1  ORF type:complete len:243 (+),score=64.66 TRINITY_DN21248_c0_g1_i1:87-815(+)